MRRIIIAIDGFSSCGKSTLAKALANKLLYLYLDTGAMYRAVTLHFLRTGVDWRKMNEVMEALSDIHISFLREVKTFTILNGENVEEEIRSMEVSRHVSAVSAIGYVREVVVAQQRNIGAAKGIVMEGRDIGTVVFPEAELKIFMTASKSIRAQRRFLELQKKGFDVTIEEVMENIMERDKLDSEREISPLQKAEDALVIDNTDLDHEQQLEIAYSWAMKKINEVED